MMGKPIGVLLILALHVALTLSTCTTDMKEDSSTFYTSLPSGEVAVLEAVLSPMTGKAPVRLDVVTDVPTPEEKFLLENETFQPGQGTLGDFHSVAGAYIALRADSVDPSVAHLNTYNRETFIKLINSGDKYTLGVITINHCISCEIKRQVVMWYTSDALEYRYYVIPTQGNQVEAIAAKKPVPEDITTMYRLWTNEPI